MRYPFVLLDAGETLLGPRESFGATYARVLGALGVHRRADEFEAALRATWDRFDREIPPGVDRYGLFEGGEHEYWLRFATRTIETATGRPVGAGLSEEALRGLRDAFLERDAWEVFPDVEPALRALRGRGVRLAVVSNWDSRLPAVLSLVGLAEYFDAVVVSHLEGIEKPHPDLFRHALARVGAEPHQALHVGDVPRLDGEGARAAGVDAVLVDRRGRLGPAHGAIRDLSPLPGLAIDGLR